MARVKGGYTAGPGIAALGTVVGVVVRDYVFQGADGRVFERGEVGADVVVEICFDDCVFGFVGVAAGGAVVPVPAVGGDDGGVVWEFGFVEDGGAGGLEEGEEGEEVGLLRGWGVCPEGMPGEAKGGGFEGRGVGEKGGVAGLRGFAVLGGGVVVVGVDAVDCVEGVGGVVDGAGEGADGVLVDAFWDYASAGGKAYGRFDAD